MDNFRKGIRKLAGKYYEISYALTLLTYANDAGIFPKRNTDQ